VRLPSLREISTTGMAYRYKIGKDGSVSVDMERVTGVSVLKAPDPNVTLAPKMLVIGSRMTSGGSSTATAPPEPALIHAAVSAVSFPVELAPTAAAGVSLVFETPL